MPINGNKVFLFVIIVFVIFPFATVTLNANEVNIENQTAVVVREHPQTGRPYLCVVKTGEATRKIFYGLQKKFKRPDYRLLDPHVSPKEAGYDGPVSDRTKVYALAAGGVAAYAALPVSAAGGAAAGGAALYAGAGVGVAAGTLSLHWAMVQDERPDDFTHTSLSRELSNPVPLEPGSIGKLS